MHSFYTLDGATPMAFSLSSTSFALDCGTNILAQEQSVAPKSKEKRDITNGK